LAHTLEELLVRKAIDGMPFATGLARCTSASGLPLGPASVSVTSTEDRLYTTASPGGGAGDSIRSKSDSAGYRLGARPASSA
jgi:hypothetical protein